MALVYFGGLFGECVTNVSTIVALKDMFFIGYKNTNMSYIVELGDPMFLFYYKNISLLF